MTVKAYKDDAGKVTVVDDALPSAAWKARRTEISLANFTGDLDSITDGTTYKKVNTSDLTSNRVDLDKIQDGSTYKKYTATEQTKLTGVETGADVTSTHEAGSCNVGNLLTGTMTADVTISNTFKTAASPNARIEITSSEIAGYSDATTKQFYLQSSDGKAYFGAGACVADSGGLTFAGGTWVTFKYGENNVGYLTSASLGISLKSAGAGYNANLYHTSGEGGGAKTAAVGVSDDGVYIYSDQNMVIGQVGISAVPLRPYAANTYALGTTTYYWSDVATTILTLSETTTPTAVTNFAKFYSKNDNCFYGQDGAGTEHTFIDSTGTTGGTGSAGSGNQYVEMRIGANTYKVLHDGTV